MVNKQFSVNLLLSLYWRLLGTDLKAAVFFFPSGEGGGGGGVRDGVELKMKAIKVEKP